MAYDPRPPIGTGTATATVPDTSTAIEYRPSRADPDAGFNPRTGIEPAADHTAPDSDPGRHGRGRSRKRKRERKNAGSYLGLVGIALVLCALILPWYQVTYDSSVAGYATDGPQELLRLSGIDGIRITPPTAENGTDAINGTIPLSFVPFLPLTIYYVVSASIAIIRVLVSRRSKKRARRLIRGGILRFLPIVILILVLTQLPALAARFVGADRIPAEIDTILHEIAGQPLGGSFAGEIGDWGAARLWWGLGIGGWLLILGPALECIGGVLDRIIGRRDE